MKMKIERISARAKTMQHWMEEACKEGWQSPDFPRPQKFLHEQSEVKQMMIFAYDHIRIILADAVFIEVTVKKEYYADFIFKKT